jgi:hypothetical protein
MAVPELCVADEIKARLSAKTLREIADNLHKRDCQTCGRPIGDQTPALSIDDGGPFLNALLHHQGCCLSGWYPLTTAAVRPHVSWTSRFFTLPFAAKQGATEPRATCIVCPHLEAVYLDRSGADDWSVNTERHWRDRGFRPMGRDLVVNQWVADQPPPRARLMGSILHIDAGYDGQWSSSAKLETIQVCRRHNGLLLGISTAFDPVAATGIHDVLRYGEAGLIFLGWIPLT